MFLPKLFVIVSVSIPNHSDFVNTKTFELIEPTSVNIESKNNTSTEYITLKAQYFIN